jgi:hypothetical protein
VLNRIDECASLDDLLRVYGTLCWNLSQITGRKDIPMIRLTYSRHAAADSVGGQERDTSYLRYLENQREELKRAIFQAPRHRLDHLATFVETHGERLAHFLEALIAYRKQLRKFRLKHALIGFFASLLGGGAAAFTMMALGLFPTMDPRMVMGGGGIFALVIFLLWMTVLMKHFTSGFHQNLLHDVDSLTHTENQKQRDSWEAIRDLVYVYLKKTSGRFSYRQVKREYVGVRRVRDEGSREIREALYELSTISDEETADGGDALSGPLRLAGEEEEEEQTSATG